MIRTALSDGEARALARLADGRRVVEAGALLGASAVVLGSTAASVVSIDKHEGYGPSTLRAYRSNLDRYALRRNVRPIVGDVVDHLPLVPADVAFIDLTGEYALTRVALESTTARVIALHDLCRVHCDGVERAIKDTGLQIVEHIDSLAVCVRAEATRRPGSPVLLFGSNRG